MVNTVTTKDLGHDDNGIPVIVSMMKIDVIATIAPGANRSRIAGDAPLRDQSEMTIRPIRH